MRSQRLNSGSKENNSFYGILSEQSFYERSSINRNETADNFKTDRFNNHDVLSSESEGMML
jgi:hypothetical protein